MDINLSYAVSNEDIAGILRTIWLFLESLNFRATSAVLQTECLSNGYRDVNEVPAKVVVVTPTALSEKPGQRHQGNQTEYPSEAEGTYNLKSSVQEVITSDNSQDPEHFFVYYTDVENFPDKFSSQAVIDEYATEVEVYGNFDVQSDAKRSAQSSVENFIEELEEMPSLSPTIKAKTSDTKRSPNTIESEIPTKILSKKSSKILSREISKQGLKKSRSNPVLKGNSTKLPKIDKGPEKTCSKSSCKCSELDIDAIDVKELREKFRQLQKEHRKLMGVTTELTTALQTHILGQSENLNSMLNNCRNIYPDLFKSGSFITKSSESVVPDSNNTTREIISLRIISSHDTQTSTTNISSEILANNKVLDQSIRFISSAPTATSKTALSETDCLKRVSSQNIQHGLSTNALNELYDPSIGEGSGQTVQKRELSADDLKKTKSDTNQNEPKFVDSITNNLFTKNSSDRILIEGTSTEVLKDRDPEPRKETSTEVTVKVKKNRKGVKRANSSSILLVTSSTSDMQKPKVLLRQHSSTSCDESFLVNPIKEHAGVHFNTITTEIDARGPKQLQRPSTTDKQTSTECKESEQIVDNRNYQVFQANCGELPEIFVTTDNLAKVQECKCRSSINSDSNSPRNRYFEIDFRKLKKDLISGDDDLKIALIQALRWRLTQSDSETRDQVISSYIRHDLLGLHSGPNVCGQSTLELFYTPNKVTPHPLQEGIARLVNTIASLTLGREYLGQDDDLLISLLVPIIIGTHYSNTNINDVTLDMLIATLQKMSLRNRQRLRMISAGLVEHLVTFLADKHSELSAYCMEYSTALFMNLCLHREARERLHHVSNDVVQLLTDLLNTKHQCCLPYVNGAMYSLLGDEYINQEAQRANLTKVIEESIERTNGEMRRQLKFILKLHVMGPADNDCGCDPNIEPENEVDLLEPELDSDDPYNKQPSGEELLKTYKLLFSIYGSQVHAAHLKCFCRPVTPMPKQSNKPIDQVTDVNGVEMSRAQSENAKATMAKQTKRWSSEPATNLKINSENVKKRSESAQSSDLNTPDMNFCEETQQFYHTPSGKSGIFESQKTKKLHRVAPSFTRTIPLPFKTECLPSRCKHPHCSQPYVKTMPITPKENSSVRNPPYGLDYSDFFPTCYRESFGHQANPEVKNGSDCDCYVCTNICPNCNRRNKYACNCYNVIKGYVDAESQDNINNNRIGNNSVNNSKSRTCQCNANGFATAHQSLCHNCQNSKTLTTQGPIIRNYVKSNQASTTVKPTSSNVNNPAVNFSYTELLNVLDSDGRIHVCSNPEVDCRCYDEVFQSRPKILRTPP